MTEENPVTIRDNRERKRFEADVEGNLAVLEYNLITDGIVVAHTEVPRAVEGRGIAGKLFQAAVASARDERRRIIPVCPVFALWIKRHAEMHDLIDPSYRRSLGLPPIEPPAG